MSTTSLPNVQRWWLDVAALGKPNIVLMSVLMAAGGMALAKPEFGLGRALIILGGIALAVAAANAFNMYLEVDIDRLMSRTALRPLPTGRLAPRWAAVAGGLSATLGMVVLWFYANPLTSVLAWAAMASYVLIYTPLKRVTPLALLIGAAPGAAPPLLGWSSVAGKVDAPGLALFGVLLVWQIPHFLAIALYRKSEYQRAGIRSVPVVWGDETAKLQAALYAGALIPLSLMLAPLGLAGRFYSLSALLAGVAFAGMGLWGLRSSAGASWARRYFLVSLVYLPLLSLSLALDRWIG